MNATKTTLTSTQRRTARKAFKVYRNTGSHKTGLWVYQPHDFDSSFELWSAAYKTRREATEAAYNELLSKDDYAEEMQRLDDLSDDGQEAH